MGRQVECVVCLEEYENGVSQVMSLPCGHEFHADCITPWLTTRRRTCPICKGDVIQSTPWLTTRRRTCPICKGDVVRSLARGSSSGPTYEPYHDESDDEDATQASSSGGRDEDVEQGILSPSPGRRESRAEAWLNRLSASFGATIRTGDPLHEDRSR
ncbi:E3 ubiquitin-protein ligase plr-1 like [Verticillium longisporum]|nr:E3 ubiquitin-protein ligase plr-1 like [Verticillium longisporum]